VVVFVSRKDDCLIRPGQGPDVGNLDHRRRRQHQHHHRSSRYYQAHSCSASSCLSFGGWQ
jgi:hypothetical protein